MQASGPSSTSTALREIRIRLSDPQKLVLKLLTDSTTRQLFAGGGAGGGKSFVGSLWQITRRITYPYTRGLIARRTYSDLRDSTMATFFDVCETLGQEAGIDFEYNDSKHTVTWSNGSQTMFRWLATRAGDTNNNRIGGMEYTDAFIDEAPEVDERAASLIMSRIRYKTSELSLLPKILYTGNPQPGWVKRKFIADDDDHPVVLDEGTARVLFGIDTHVDRKFAEEYTQTLEFLDDYDRARLLHGDWSAAPKSDRPFAWAFNRERHVRPVERRPGDLVHISIDFNVDPFSAIAAHIWEDQNGPHFHVFAEVALKTASVQMMADWIRAQSPTGEHLLRITGDRGGTSRIIGINGAFTLFGELQRKLGIPASQLSLPPNPTHLLSRSQTNTVLKAHPDARVDPSCRRLISDMQAVSVDGSGSIVKSDRSKTNQQADALDCYRYLCNTFLRRWIERREGQRPR
jgi:phage terminase large subunit